MDIENIFSNCLKLLAEIYHNEKNINGQETARFLREVNLTSFELDESEETNKYSEVLKSFTSNSDHELVHYVTEIAHLLPWYQANMGGRIDENLKKQMIMTELVGPHSIVKSSKYEIGIFLQFPNVNYPARRHPAEETFFTLSGKSFWKLENDDEVEKRVGEYIHHPSMSSHSNRTTDSHLIASWRWSGDISLESYNNCK